MKIAIVGAGGHATVVADILLRMRATGDRVEPVAFITDDPAPERRDILSVPVVPGGVRSLGLIAYDAVIVAIGDNKSRRRISDHLRRDGVQLAIARHPSSIIAADVDMGSGTVVCAGVVVNPSSFVGCSVILNTQSSIDHHNVIGDYVHVAPGSHLAGGVSIGEETLIGMGSTVLPGLRIGRGSVLGAASVVTKDLPDRVLAFGSPARVQRGVEEPRPLSAVAEIPV